MSSAYKKRLHFTAIGISLAYIKNSKGPSIDTCGTPHKMLEISGKELSKLYTNFLI